MADRRLSNLLPWRRVTKNAPTGTPDGIQAAIVAEGMDATGPLGPGRPLNPVQGYSQPPRAMDYPVAANVSLQSRATWGRTSFDTLKAIVDAYDVARMCINHKIDELRSMDLLLVPLDGGKGKDIDGAISAARAALEFPDREAPYDEWVSKLLEDALRYDATPLYRRRNLNGDVIGYEVLDGPSIVPYIDQHGRRPKPPAPAYFQRVKGQVWNWFTSDDLTYAKFRPQTDSPYGLAPMESILLTANTDLRFQWHFLQMFTDGTVPAGFMELPPDATSPDQVAEWQDYWDAMVMGDQAKLHQLLAVPNGTKVTGTRPAAFDKTFPEYLMTRTCAAFGVVPQDIGLTGDVNRATGETQMDIQFRVNTLPWVIWLQGILTRYVRYDLGLPVQVKLDTGRDKEDRLAEAQAWDIAVKGGAASPDEWRSEVYGLPIDDERPMPRFIFSPRTGPVPLASLLAIAGRINPETGSPVDNVPLAQAPYDGVGGILPDKAPGGTDFKRAPINPDEDQFPALEHAVPGTDVVAKPAPAAQVAKEMTAGVTSDTGITGVDLRGETQVDGDDDEDELLAAAMEKAAYARFVKARRKAGRWRDFTFTHVDATAAHRANQAGRAQIRKDAGQMVAAGLVVRAADTGRVLMLQRALDPQDPAGGRWEFPGGHVEDGESPAAAAVREWQEEVGALLPLEALVQAAYTGPAWVTPDGVYAGFVVTVPDESAVPLAGRDQVSNPDDPDGDGLEAIAWWAPADVGTNPALRAELAASWPLVAAALTPGAVAKAVTDPRWVSHPVRHVEDALAGHAQASLAAALGSAVTRGRLRAVVAAYLGSDRG